MNSRESSIKASKNQFRAVVEERVKVAKKKAEEDFRPFFIKLYEGMNGDGKITPEQMAAAAAAAGSGPTVEEVE